MANHTFNAFQLCIGGCFAISQDQLGIKDIEALVLHGTHVEVAHGDKVELIEVIFQAKSLLIPSHAALQAGHGMGAEVLIAGLYMNAQSHRTP